ncbi:thermonuclease family protein [Paracoccus laeviglucosivorans]|uniref:Endonuclease YncB, thermonuclease family n=1 Tax=Paracoccus laeviglucosivorans TaxID=1197861 RepID=A0A521FU39_9RHOB|nr:thermonuclease family protein [Paracoccus laeviglucosivorans]SMO99090.1 Endonuclease YncB, thermonuclease family [Paracoccus laeviglucosivorans]
MTRSLASTFALFLFATCASAGAADIVGIATVIDGDTIEIHGERIRLAGIDAPEAAQLCQTTKGQPWRCGQQAALALAGHLSQRTVHCVPTGRDQYRRVLAYCRVKGDDIGLWMVSSGRAVGYYDRDKRYGEAERTAVRRKIGIWQGAFERPHLWRKARRDAVKSHKQAVTN